MYNIKNKNFLQDKNFLEELNTYKIHTIYVKITALTFKEQPIQEIQGKAVSGSISVSGDSCLRRTLNNLQLIADEQTNQITNLKNIISLNKKIKIEIGLENPIKDKYDKILWFPQGIFLITQASISTDSSGIKISLSGKDKMMLLDGTAGGTFPSTVIFHERYEYNDKNEIKKSSPTIFQIIQEAVNHYGKEHINNIIISDVPEITKKLVKYIGEIPVRFTENYEQLIFSNTEAKEFKNKYTYGQDIGYMETKFIYPGELIFQAGSTVVDLLNKICEVMGNYEFFYNLQGKFVFQEKKNYLNHQYSPIKDLQFKDYIYTNFNTKYAYNFLQEEDIISCNNSPNYSKIKNNFLVIGQRTDAITDISYNIKYHLAIDKKPYLNKSKKYMRTIKNKLDNSIVRYEYTDTEEPRGIKLNPNEFIDGEAIKPGLDWREELYRQALENSLYNNEETIYDQELLSEWRKIFNPNNKEWEKNWKEKYGKDWVGWNPQIRENPCELKYWLEFIDSNSLLDYSIGNIGCRTKVINSNEINTLYNNKVQDVIFLDGEDKNIEEKRKRYELQGQPYHQLRKEYLNYFCISGTKASAFDILRESIYQNLTYQEQISITCLPRYYLEPNTLIYLREKKANIEGEYFINSFNIPLNCGETMTINATKNLTRDILK